MILLSLAWGHRHRILAHRLAASAERFGLEVHVRALPGEAPSRPHAWALRPAMILEALDQADCPVVMIDADAVVHQAPRLFPCCFDGADFMAVPCDRFGWRLGVLWAAPTARGKAVLRALRDRLNDGTPYENDEPIFRDLVAELGAVVQDLPPEYNWCEAWGDRERKGNRIPVIETNAIEKEAPCSSP